MFGLAETVVLPTWVFLVMCALSGAGFATIMHGIRRRFSR